MKEALANSKLERGDIKKTSRLSKFEVSNRRGTAVRNYILHTNFALT